MIEGLYILDSKSNILYGNPKGIAVISKTPFSAVSTGGDGFCYINHCGYIVGATHHERDDIMVVGLLKKLAEDLKVENFKANRQHIIEKVDQYYISGFDLKKPEKARKNEILFDIVENLETITNDRGIVIQNILKGEVYMKSFIERNIEVIFKKVPDMFVLVDNKKMVKTDTIDPKEGDSGTLVLNLNTYKDMRLLKYVIKNPRASPLKLIKKKHNWWVLECSQEGVNDLIIKIPIPIQSYNVKSEIDDGTAATNNNFLIVKIPKLEKKRSNIKIEYDLLDNKDVTLPPIEMSYTFPLYSSSGFLIESVKQKEKQKAEIWVKHMLVVKNHEIRSEKP